MSASERLAELGIELPDVVPPAGVYVPAVRTGNLVYTAGQLPMQSGKLAGIGKVGAVWRASSEREEPPQPFLKPAPR